MKLTLTFATSTGDTIGMGSHDKNDLHGIWLTVCLLIGTNPDLYDVLLSNWQTGLFSGTTFLDIGRTVFENDATVFALEICLSQKALIEIECNLETVGNGGKLALLNTKEINHRDPQFFCV